MHWKLYSLKYERRKNTSESFEAAESNFDDVLFA